MPRRRMFDDAVTHVINRGADKRPIFMDDDDKRRFLELIGEHAEPCGVQIWSFALMTNHFHLQCRSSSLALSEMMHKVCLTYAREFNTRNRRIGVLFEGRYKSYVVRHKWRAVGLSRYIHLNPWEAGMESTIGEYPWTSHPYFVGSAFPPSWLRVNEVLSIVSPRLSEAKRMYAQFLKDGMSMDFEKELKKIHSRSQRPDRRLYPLFGSYPG